MHTSLLPELDFHLDILKNWRSRSTFANHEAAARARLRLENVKKLMVSEHFSKMRLAKCARDCCESSISLPQYHFSSPCKLSCSEPQRTLLSVELRSSSIFLRFPPALDDFPSFSVVFFLPFSCHSSIFLHVPPVFNDFPSFSLGFFLPFSCRSQWT